MTDMTDFEDRFAEHLRAYAAPAARPPRREAVAMAVAAGREARRGTRFGQRWPTLPRLSMAVATGAAAVALFAVATVLLSNLPRSIEGPGASLETPKTAVDVPNFSATFVSPTYGYTYKSPSRRILEEATEIWDPANQPVDDRDPDGRIDGVETGLAAYFEGASTQIPDEISIDGWVDEFVTPTAAGGCGVPRSQQAEITIDGQSGRIAECPNHIEATVVAGGRLYLFTMVHQRSDARAWFDAWVTTIDLTPETAAVP